MRWFLTAILLGVISPVFSQQYQTKKGEVTFLSQAALNEFEGKSSSLQGLIDLDQNLLDFYLDLNTLDTGIGLRDKHMRENYLETEEFPFAEFTGKLSAVQKPEPGKVQQVTAIGKFKLHGVERAVTVKGTLNPQANGSLLLEAKFSIVLSDYQIEIPKLVFYELAPEQQVSLKATLTPKK
ncbi:YceI family protein [Algoriphagus lacus]|uniref:YceI family protein n=1 Tax=Algoriphagus lacus TaxID=2056311 RepID=A0A418PRP3_9BACT|nr:YceI family protein [Algoriphagus lacus]RIW15549.1 YceI family protein [Algoriphagus lacus]